MGDGDGAWRGGIDLSMIADHSLGEKEGAPLLLLVSIDQMDPYILCAHKALETAGKKEKKETMKIEQGYFFFFFILYLCCVSIRSGTSSCHWYPKQKQVDNVSSPSSSLQRQVDRKDGKAKKMSLLTSHTCLYYTIAAADPRSHRCSKHGLCSPTAVLHSASAGPSVCH